MWRKMMSIKHVECMDCYNKYQYYVLCCTVMCDILTMIYDIRIRYILKL